MEKNFYVEDPTVANRSCEEVEQIRSKNNKIQVKNLHEKGEGTIPNPVVTFEEAFAPYRKSNMSTWLLLNYNNYLTSNHERK